MWRSSFPGPTAFSNQKNKNLLSSPRLNLYIRPHIFYPLAISKKKYRIIKRILLLLLVLLVVTTAAMAILFYAGSPVTENTDTYVYNLPYKEGAAYRVVQGYGGLFSHKNIAALDFSMPEGTPVCAAREGVVYSYKDDSDKGGPFPKYKNSANYIMIKHNDGSIGCYWHLQKGGIKIKKGAVARGEVIGYSGSTGFVWKPHLHFSVKRKLNYQKDAFVKTKFATTKGILFLERGSKYERPVMGRL
jgi:murein DD-endopeptidase MepM/ murein hydrolase activator NlpD